MYKIVRKSEGMVRKIADNKIATNYITKDITKYLSLATTEAKDYYEKVKTTYNRIYFVLEGELVLKFDDSDQKLHEGDTCFVEKGTNYEMLGTFKAIIINQPAFGT